MDLKRKNMCRKVDKSAAHIITRFFRKVKRCFVSQKPVPFSKQIFTGENQCFHTYCLVQFLVRITCADEASTVDPICPKTHKLLPAPFLLVLCLRTSKPEERILVNEELLQMCKQKEFLELDANIGPFCLKAYKAIETILHQTQNSCAPILLYRLGLEALKNLPLEKRRLKQTQVLLEKHQQKQKLLNILNNGT